MQPDDNNSNEHDDSGGLHQQKTVDTHSNGRRVTVEAASDNPNSTLRRFDVVPAEDFEQMAVREVEEFTMS